MRQRLTIFTVFFILIFHGLESTGQFHPDDDYWLKICDSTVEHCGYATPYGDVTIPRGKYPVCFTDTFRTYAIVTIPGMRIMAIDRQENLLYEVFVVDNGPDYPSEGLFRIVENNKIGFADEFTGRVVIKPQFDCAWPFEHGVAKVSNHCETQSDGEHTAWFSDEWFYIYRSGEGADGPYGIGEVTVNDVEDHNMSVNLPVYLDQHDPIFITIKNRVLTDLRQRADTGSSENKFFAARINDLSKKQRDQFQAIVLQSITDYTIRTKFNAGMFMLIFNEMGMMDSTEIKNEFDIRVSFLGHDSYAAEFWEKHRDESPMKVMALLYVKEEDGSITFQDPFQPAIDFLTK